MNTLHEVVYQIVSNRALLAEIAQDAQVLFEKFNLSPLEANSLLALIQNDMALHILLSVQDPIQMLSVNVWVP